jgi:hypothetical protein
MDEDGRTRIKSEECRAPVGFPEMDLVHGDWFMAT